MKPPMIPPTIPTIRSPRTPPGPSPGTTAFARAPPMIQTMIRSKSCICLNLSAFLVEMILLNDQPPTYSPRLTVPKPARGNANARLHSLAPAQAAEDQQQDNGAD